MSAGIAKGLLQAVEDAGLSEALLLRAADLEPGRLKGQARVPLSKIYRLCELALDFTRDPALGLHWAERLGDTEFAPVSHLLAHSTSLRNAFTVLAQFDRLICDRPTFRLAEERDVVIVHVQRFAGQSLRMEHFSAEIMVGGFFRLVRKFLAKRGRCGRASFAYAAPAHRAEYVRLFEGAVSFERPFTGLAIDRRLFDAPKSDNDPDVLEAMQAVAERRLLQMTRKASYAARLRDFLIRGGWRLHGDMTQAACSLGVSVRSLRRHLAAEGTAFNTVAHDALATVAKHFLVDQGCTIHETAYEMGFSDPSTFHRAFKRWTGTTPGAYQDAQSQGAIATALRSSEGSLHVLGRGPSRACPGLGQASRQ